MTRTNVMASSRPQAPRPARGGRSRAASRITALAVIASLCALAFPGGALAAEKTTTGYNSTPPPPTTPTTTPTPTTGTSPSKESSEPTKSSEPSKSTQPASETKATSGSTLPFTGFDLRWSLLVGIALIGAGFSIFAMQRRQRRGSNR